MKESKYLCSVEGLNLWKVPRLFPLHINHMTKDIKIFENPDFGQVRTTTGENGTPFFCAVDVCRALGYGNSREALRKHVMEDDVTKRDTIDSIGRKQHTSFINESGFYALVFSSKLPKAREFKHWVTSEVLPQIRKTGGYIPVSKQDDEKMILCKAIDIMKRTTKVTGRGQQYFVNGFITGRFKVDNQNFNYWYRQNNKLFYQKAL